MLRRFGWLLCLVPVLALGQNLTGDWVVTTEIYGYPLGQKLTLKSEAGKLTGKLGDHDLQGTVEGTRIHFVSKNKAGDASRDYTGSLQGDMISGSVVIDETGDSPEHIATTFTARKIPDKPAVPKRHEFIPTIFYRE